MSCQKTPSSPCVTYGKAYGWSAGASGGAVSLRSRSGAPVAKCLLEGFKGYLHTDGYDGYNAAVDANHLTPVGCMAHARRKFAEAVKAQGKNKRRGKAHRGLMLIQKLYRVEKQERILAPEKRRAQRQLHAQPILDEMRTWLNQALPQVPPTSATGKALNYLHNLLALL